MGEYFHHEGHEGHEVNLIFFSILLRDLRVLRGEIILNT